MANIRTPIAVAQPHRAQFAYRVVFDRPIPYTMSEFDARAAVIRQLGPLSWNELAKSADFYKNRTKPVRDNAIRVARDNLPEGALL